ncbi:hypothetical protein B1A99_18580 [Cohnella sp. CIP 111063]|uniref:stalk domain-containing protein n=1 Tax=unclassified Cohnella TaxID=2636738 RepID=UPI000B8C6B9F|nr:MULTISPECIES: hypothetical protein [unclassified Cohnella]OXS56869.1 hypothetical protein B1A99_18580 [Cohnella sp. CIP 111063]PRX69706.1 hypothetical protein B0G52_11264 [Cohnella sp. SGD-V74]
MKQMLKYAIVFLAGAICATAGSAYGAEAIKTISAKLRPDIKVSVNGKQLDASAISYNNSTYLPLRKAAEAVGGKIELNGKDINIVTKSSPIETGTSSTGSTTGTPGNEQLEETYPIEGKVLYENNETYNKFNGLNKPIWIVTVKNGQNTVVYNGVDYIATRYTDYYYDSQNDRLYFTREFLLQFLSQSDLDGIASYNVNIKNKKITPILP